MSIDSLKVCTKSSKSGDLITPAGIILFAAVGKRFKPQENKSDDRPGGWSISLMFPPDVDLTLLRMPVQAAMQARFGGKPPAGCRMPIKKIRAEEGEALRAGEREGWFKFGASTYTERPGLVFGDGKRVDVPLDGETVEDMLVRVTKEAYSGRWARAAVSAEPHYYDVKSNKGYKFYLNNVQLLQHGDKIGPYRAAAEEDFGIVAAPAAEDPDDIF